MNVVIIVKLLLGGAGGEGEVRGGGRSQRIQVLSSNTLVLFSNHSFVLNIFTTASTVGHSWTGALSQSHHCFLQVRSYLEQSLQVRTYLEQSRDLIWNRQSLPVRTYLEQFLQVRTYLELSLLIQNHLTFQRRHGFPSHL